MVKAEFFTNKDSGSITMKLTGHAGQDENGNDRLYSLAEKFDNCYVIDLYRYGPVYDDGFKKHYFYYSHMSPAGYIMTAKLIDSYIDYIIRHNPEDFKTVGFIGTGIEY